MSGECEFRTVSHMFNNDAPNVANMRNCREKNCSLISHFTGSQQHPATSAPRRHHDERSRVADDHQPHAKAMAPDPTSSSPVLTHATRQHHSHSVDGSPRTNSNVSSVAYACQQGN
ncbi:hypothetical protein GQ600_2723 [Phytophthora cactorum]|nr:hypothetical protein GQ600_2723 [Phytophthora cactorum]